MTRTNLVLFASVAGLLAFTTEVQAGKKLYVGNLPFSPVDQVGVFDPSTNPTAHLANIAFGVSASSDGSRNPDRSFVNDFSLNIVNPDSNGLGDAASLDVSYPGPAGDFPATSFFDVLVSATDPDTGPSLPLSNVSKLGPFDEVFDVYATIDKQSRLSQVHFHYELNPNAIALGVVGVVTDLNLDGTLDIVLQLSKSGTVDFSQPLFNVTMDAQSVPEPSTLALAGGGVVALVGVARNRKIRR